MPARRNPERSRLPGLAMPPDLAIADLERQLAEGSELRSVKTPDRRKGLEDFRSRFERWTDCTTERLRRMFDQDDYADRFYSAASEERITPRVEPFWGYNIAVDFNRLQTFLRQALAVLESLRDLVRDGVVGPASPPQPVAVARPRFRDVHIHVDSGAAIGEVNVGASVQNIQSHINALAGPDAETIARAFKELTEAAAGDTALDDLARREVIEHFEDLAEQAGTPPDRRRLSRIGGALERIPALMQTAMQAREAWVQWGPTIEELFRHL
jgi:hypothetical protein